jgi:diguanylate cyclase (GGDEF)-like protein
MTPPPMTRKSSLFCLGVRQKMLAILLTVLVVSISISSWYTLQKQEQDIYDAIRVRGEEVLKYASRAIALYAISYDYHSIQLLLDEVVTSPDIIHAHVTSAKGNIMATAGPRAEFGEDRPTFINAIKFDDKVVGELTVELNPKDIVRRMEESRNVLLLRELALIIFVAIGEFIALSYFIARPVAIISNSLERSVDDDGLIQKDIPIQSRDEFGLLATQFNLMRDQLNAAHGKLQSRIEAADHRLLETNKALTRQSEELQEMNHRLMELSITDDLTGLYNRRHFEESVNKELAYSVRHGTPFSLVILDVDRFKQINDNHGHATGDQVLRKIASLVRQNIRSTDIPCRIGGEEFAVACRGSSHDEAIQLAERLRKASEDTAVDSLDEQIHFTVSGGVATLAASNGDHSLDTIFSHADRALYHSKQEGRNRITHHDDITQVTPYD